MKRLTRWAGTALLLTLAVAACDTGDGPIGVDGDPSLSLHITDVDDGFGNRNAVLVVAGESRA